jgi:hypothetical protein
MSSFRAALTMPIFVGGMNHCAVMQTFSVPMGNLVLAYGALQRARRLERV